MCGFGVIFTFSKGVMGKEDPLNISLRQVLVLVLTRNSAHKTWKIVNNAIFHILDSVIIFLVCELFRMYLWGRNYKKQFRRCYCVDMHDIAVLVKKFQKSVKSFRILNYVISYYNFFLRFWLLPSFSVMSNLV